MVEDTSDNEKLDSFLKSICALDKCVPRFI